MDSVLLSAKLSGELYLFQCWNLPWSKILQRPTGFTEAHSGEDIFSSPLLWVGHRGTHTGLLDIQKITDIVTEEKAGPSRGVLNQACPLPNGWITSQQSAFFLSFFHFNLSLSGLRAGNLCCCNCPKQRVSGSFHMGWPGPCRDSVTLEALTWGELSLEGTLGNHCSSLNNQGSFH